MKLPLKGTPITSPRTKERVQRAHDIMEEIKEQMADIGLAPYPRPRNTPEPLDEELLESASNRELEKHLVHYTGYAAYLQTKLVEAQIAYRACTINMKAVKNSLKSSLFKDRVPAKEIDSRVALAPEFIEQELEQLKLYAVQQMLEAHYNAYSKQASAVSRVVELRKLEFEQSRREHNVSHYKPGRGRPIEERPGRLHGRL